MKNESEIKSNEMYNEKMEVEFKNQNCDLNSTSNLEEEISFPEDSQTFNKILEEITLIDYVKESGLDDPQKLQIKHFLVILVDKILELAKIHGLDLCISDGYIYAFNGQYWTVKGREYLKYFLGLAALKSGIDKHTAKYYSFKSKLLSQMLDEALMVKPVDNSSTVLVNFKNGTLEVSIEGVSFREFRSEDFLKYQLPFVYDPNAKAPLFHKFLNEVLPDVPCQMVLAEYLGYVFIKTSVLKLEKALVLYGTGANGKSVVYDIVNALLGSANISNYSLDNLMDSKGYHRAMLVNKLLNYTSEMNSDVESNLFKQLASGEDVEARPIYCQPIIIKDYAKLAFNCNVLPKNVEHTKAYFRRFTIIRFGITIEEEKQDKQLAQKIIAAELSGIFNWVLEGLNRLLANKKLTVSELIDAELTKYQIESDNVKMFLDECNYVETFDRHMSVKLLSNEYSEFCKEGRYKPVNHSNFVKRLRALNLRVEKRNTGLVVFIEKSETNERNDPSNKPFITPFEI